MKHRKRLGTIEIMETVSIHELFHRFFTGSPLYGVGSRTKTIEIFFNIREVIKIF
jgi:hypothetical protein